LSGQSYELIKLALGQEDIIRRDARLTGVQELAVDDALDRARQCRVCSPRMHGDLPPSSSVTGVRFSAAACMTSRPTAVEPV
jgi:hypothetical protein